MSLLTNALLAEKTKITVESELDGKRRQQSARMSGTISIYNLIAYIPKAKWCKGRPIKITIDIN